MALHVTTLAMDCYGCGCMYMAPYMYGAKEAVETAVCVERLHSLKMTAVAGNTG
jgi:hypothetical protein